MPLPDWLVMAAETLEELQRGFASFDLRGVPEEARPAIRGGRVQLVEARRLLDEAQRGVLLASIRLDRGGLPDDAAVAQAVGEALYRGVTASLCLHQPWAFDRYRWESRRGPAGRAALERTNKKRRKRAALLTDRIQAIKLQRPKLTATQIQGRYAVEHPDDRLPSLDVIYRALRRK